jgi:hypothetical protein
MVEELKKKPVIGDEPETEKTEELKGIEKVLNGLFFF